MAQKLEEKALDHVIDDVIGMVQNSKDEIFSISEEAQKEYEQLNKELQETKEQVTKHISDGEELEQKVQFSRERLFEVSQDFDHHSENEIREVYENTQDRKSTRLNSSHVSISYAVF